MAYRNEILPNMTMYAAVRSGSETVFIEVGKIKNYTLEEKLNSIGSQMLSLQQRIWELNEEINVNEGAEQIKYMLQQNKLRKEYAALKQEKTDFESHKIKPEPFKLEGYVMTEDGYYIPKDDDLQNLKF